MSEARWPDAVVKQVGEDGNAFSILGRTSSAIRKVYGADAAKEYTDEATSGDYNHLLAFTMQNTSQPEYEDDFGDAYGDDYNNPYWDEEEDW